MLRKKKNSKQQQQTLTLVRHVPCLQLINNPYNIHIYVCVRNMQLHKQENANCVEQLGLPRCITNYLSSQPLNYAR